MAGKKMRVLLFLMMALCLCGCGRIFGEGSASGDEKGYIVYYTNLDGTKLEGRSYEPSADSFDGILTELLDRFQKPADPEVSSALPLGVNINSCTMGIDELQVDFDAGYLGISNVQEVLLQAGLVKTLVQLPGVVRVRFTVDGQPLTDDGGSQVAAMDEDTFIDTKGEGINSYHYVTLNLYFANEDGNKVSRETRNVYYSSNLIMEEVIVEQIIRGPVSDNLQPVVSSGVSINSVSISRGICEIDLNGAFNQAPEGSSASPEICLYAFVNAIFDACDVEGVRFEVDGESQVRFRGQVNLDQTFVRNSDVIETAGGVLEPLTEIFLDERGDETEADASAQPAGSQDGGQTLQPETAAQTELQTSAPEENQEGGSQEENQQAPENAGEDGAAREAVTEGTSDTAGSGQNKGVGVDPSLTGDHS